MAMEITEEMLENGKYEKHFDKNFAVRLLKNLRKATSNKPALLSKTTGIIVFGLGHLLSALENPTVPIELRMKIIGTIGYIILPIDLIPDSIPVFGYADDAGVLKLLWNDIQRFSSFSMNELDAEIDREEGVNTVALPAVVESEVKAIEANPETAEVPETDEKGNIPFAVLEENIEKSLEWFQQFLDKNAELDNDFNKQHDESKETSGDMWNAISRL